MSRCSPRDGRAGSIRGRVIAGNWATSTWKSRAWLRPTSRSARPSAATISVALGSRDTIRGGCMVMAIVLERRELPSRCLCLLGLRLLAPFPMDEPQIAEIDEQAGALSEDEHRVLAPQRVHEQDGAAGQIGRAHV